MKYVITPEGVLEGITVVGILALVTIILEMAPVLIGFKKAKYKYKIPLLIGVNIVTNGILNLILNAYFIQYGFTYFVLELAIVLVEGVIYYLAIYDISFNRALSVSLIANLFSAVVGVFLLLLFRG